MSEKVFPFFGFKKAVVWVVPRYVAAFTEQSAAIFPPQSFILLLSYVRNKSQNSSNEQFWCISSKVVWLKLLTNK